jgi:hypothetical protein
MDRFAVGGRNAYWAALFLGVLSAVGCHSVAFTAMYLFKGLDEDPDFAGLKGKRVAVVCRTPETFSGASVSRELAKRVSLLLGEKVPKIKMIEQQEVANWMDKNTWEEYSEIGKALKADLVVAIEMEQFSDLVGQTLLQGKANVTVLVYDCHKGGKEVFQKHLPPVVYPRSMPVPLAERGTEETFRHEFIMVLADRIGRLFYAHDPHADIGEDAVALGVRD